MVVCSFTRTMPSDDAESVVFSIQASPKPLSAERNQVRVNYRVRDLEGLKRQLRTSGVKIEQEEDSEYGGFAWVLDPEGNKIELYQPAG